MDIVPFLWSGVEGVKSKKNPETSMRFVFCVHRERRSEAMATCEGNSWYCYIVQSMDASSEISANTVDCTFGTRLILIEQLNEFGFLLVIFLLV